jgi:hypothetical protein
MDGDKGYIRIGGRFDMDSAHRVLFNAAECSDSVRLVTNRGGIEYEVYALNPKEPVKYLTQGLKRIGGVPRRGGREINIGTFDEENDRAEKLYDGNRVALPHYP